MLRQFVHPVACCWMLLRVVAQSLKPVKLFSQQLPTFLLFRDRRSVAQQCWIRLHSSSNIDGVTHAHYAWFTKTYGLYPSHDALQVPTLIVGSCCIRLHTTANTHATILNSVDATMLGVVASVCRQPYAMITLANQVTGFFIPFYLVPWLFSYSLRTTFSLMNFFQPSRN